MAVVLWWFGVRIRSMLPPLLLLLLLLLTRAATIDATVPKNIIVVGGSSGMGKAAAMECVQRGGKCLILSRSCHKLKTAAEELRTASGHDGDDCVVVEWRILDASNETAVSELAQELSSNSESYDGLVVSAAGKAPHGSIADLSTLDVQQLMDSKFWSAYLCAKHFAPILKPGSGIVFVAGVLNRRPGRNCVPLASTNGALEGLTRSLALELGPALRVNCLSPGFCDTERFDRMPPAKKSAMLANTAESLPLKRVGSPSDMGQAIYYLLGADFVTGTILDVDGGHGIRQYANPNSDPMRQNE